MARIKSITTIENEIAKIQDDLDKLRKKEDDLSEKLLSLQKEKRECEVRLIADAYDRSGKTLHELMIFLGAE